LKVPIIGIGLQSRINSQRLPGKALLPLGSQLVLNHVLRRLKHISAPYYGILTDSESFPHFQSIAHNEGFMIMAGDPEDVLDRYYQFSKAYHLDLILRATGDNPLVFVSYVSDFLHHLFQLETLPDYSILQGLPYGAGIEFIRTQALAEAWNKARAPYQREHVCPYLYENPQKFSIYKKSAPPNLKGENIRITLDTQEDYRFLQELFQDPQIEQPGNDEFVIQRAQDILSTRRLDEGGVREYSST